MQILVEARLDTPAMAVIVNRCQAAANGQTFAQARGGRQNRFLLDMHNDERLSALNFAAIEELPTGDDLQKRGFSGPVAADQADALTR